MSPGGLKRICFYVPDFGSMPTRSSTSWIAAVYTLTYVAPEKERTWKNWYVLSGVANNMVFYYRRWYLEDSIGSIEFNFLKELSPLYDKLIPAMTQELSFTETSPKIEP
jgi:hypothetical protein